ncbi:MAG: 5-formyltetrahydrofolate cyclo-ligase [Thermodesulfovibrionales bacterium]
MIDKSLLRRELLKKRDAIPSGVRKAKDRVIHERLMSLDEIKKANVLFFFASFRSEVNTLDAIAQLLINGKRIVLPKVDRERHVLLLYEVKGIEELTAGYMNIPEPAVLTEERMVDIYNVDAAIVPGAGFDAEGNRIGYGGGYYDRLLSSLTHHVPVVALAYEEQIVESVPAEPHDIRADMIVTDRRVIRCTPANSA